MSTSVDRPYWLYAWLDTHGIKTAAAISGALQSAKICEDLHQHAQEAPVTSGCPPGHGLFAGRGLDLSGWQSCSGYSCRKREVDILLHRAWHYFDFIVIEDSVAVHVEEALDGDEAQRKEWCKMWLVPDIALALYLREIGADSLVEFQRRMSFCDDCAASRGEEMGMTAGDATIERLATEFMSEGTIVAPVHFEDWAPSAEEVGFEFRHPKAGIWLHSFDRKEVASLPPEGVLRKIAIEHARLHVAGAVADVYAAKSRALPLGLGHWSHERMIGGVGDGDAFAQVAFALNLPVLEGVDADTLLQLRSDERDSFDRFRHALRRAVSERLRDNGSADPKRLADEIRADLIEPRLHEIHQRLKTAERLLLRKSSVGIALAATTTACGLLAGATGEIAAAAGIALMSGSTMTTAAKHLEQAEEIRSDDMFFLWQALEHVHHA